MEHSEFEQMLTMLQAIDDFWKHFAYPMMAKFQYNMMAWLDDTVGLKIANFKSNPQFPFTIQCQLSWSKNVHEERSIPYQILLGSVDHRYCILLGLVLYLELWMSGKGQHSNHIFVAQTETIKQVKDACSSAMKRYVFNSPHFIKVDDQPIGMHSLCKLPATFAKRNNCTQEEIEIHG